MHTNKPFTSRLLGRTVNLRGFFKLVLFLESDFDFVLLMTCIIVAEIQNKKNVHCFFRTEQVLLSSLNSLTIEAVTISISTRRAFATVTQDVTTVLV